MKKIFCELCEGTEFTKENGMFVCYGCGTRYTADEARGMMREVEGNAPIVTGTPVVSVPVGNPNQAQIDNLLILASNAKESGNNQEAESYCNQVIALDATSYKAWFLKGKAIGWSSKLDDNRMEEAAHSFCKAIDFAPDEEKDEMKTQAVEELKSLGLACISLRKDNFGNSPSEKNLAGFLNDRLVLLKSLKVLLNNGYIVGMPEGYLEEIATMMNDSACAAYRMATKAWKNVDHPSDKDLSTYLDWIVNIEKLLRDAIDASDDDDEADIQRYKNLAIVIEDPIGKWSYKREWNSWSSSYEWVRSKSLANSAVQKRRSQAQECRNKISKIERLIEAKKNTEAAKKKSEALMAEQERKARIEAYWEAHAEEKAALDAELGSLKEKVRKIDSEIKDLNAQIKAANPSDPVPSEAETLRLNDQIKELESRRARLGVFAGKEKKQIGEEIASLNGRVDSLKARIEEEKRARKEEVDKKIAPLRAKYKELRLERDKANKRISAINAELTRDPEE